MVHQDFESGMTKKNRTRIASAGDKLFPSLDDQASPAAACPAPAPCMPWSGAVS